MIITVSSAIDKLVMVYHSLALELFPDECLRVRLFLTHILPSW